MLKDLGLQTEEQIKNHKEFLSNRLVGNSNGCISSLICSNCNHLISDSICLCAGVFACPNCNHENGRLLIPYTDTSKETKQIKSQLIVWNDPKEIQPPDLCVVLFIIFVKFNAKKTIRTGYYNKNLNKYHLHAYTDGILSGDKDLDNEYYTILEWADIKNNI